ncbi:MAG: hypothetical protein MMC33_009971 [Icmadophila ericetorum]|nr:hypothetical protein [Icmadophila ericetorum]
MPFQIQPINKSEAPTYISLLYAAYAADPVSRLFYSCPVSPTVVAASTTAALTNWGADPNERVFCVREVLESGIEGSATVDSAGSSGNSSTGVSEGHSAECSEASGEMIAALMMNFMPRREDKVPMGEGWKKEPDWKTPEGWSEEGFLRVSRDTWRKQIDVMGGEPFIFIPTVITLPSHHRRGAATVLLKHAIDQGRQYNLPIYLTASPSGLPLYEKNGFKVVNEGVKIDLSSVGIAQPRFTTCMILDAPHPDQPPKFTKGFIWKDGVLVLDEEEREDREEGKPKEQSA